MEWDAGGRYAAGVCLFDGNGGVRAAGAWRLLMDLMDRMDLMDKLGAPRDTPWVGGAAVEVGRRGQMCRGGMLCLLDSNGGVQAAGA